MLISLNRKWKWFIGYFLQAKSTANIQVGLIKTGIHMAYKVGLKVWSVTCDGTYTNLSTMNKLGCKLSESYSDIVEWFNVPGIYWNVHYSI